MTKRRNKRYTAYLGWALSLLLLGLWGADHLRLRMKCRPLEELHSVMFVANAEEIAGLSQNVSVAVFPRTCAVTRADGATLARVGRLPSLRGLIVRGEGYSDDDLRSLECLKHLYFLALSGSAKENGNLSDDSLRIIAETFPELKTLRFRRQPALTGESGVDLRSLTKLEVLSFEHCGISSTGLAQMEFPPLLNNLTITGSDIDDRALVQISKLPNLELLDLSGARLTGEDLHRLTSLKKLKELRLPKLELTLDEIRQFEEELPPGCSVFIEGRPVKWITDENVTGEFMPGQVRRMREECG